MSEQRAIAARAAARCLYDHHAPRAAPDFDELPQMAQHSLLEAGNLIASAIWEAVVPTSPDVAVLQMRIQMLATEVGEQRKVGGQEMREALLDLLVGL